jgi:hypothetical protein
VIRCAPTSSPPSARAPAGPSQCGSSTTRHGGDEHTDEHIDLTELEDAPAAGTLIDQLTTAFPGAEIIEE